MCLCLFFGILFCSLLTADGHDTEFPSDGGVGGVTPGTGGALTIRVTAVVGRPRHVTITTTNVTITTTTTLFHRHTIDMAAHDTLGPTITTTRYYNNDDPLLICRRFIINTSIDAHNSMCMYVYM